MRTSYFIILSEIALYILTYFSPGNGKMLELKVKPKHVDENGKHWILYWSVKTVYRDSRHGWIGKSY